MASTLLSRFARIGAKRSIFARQAWIACTSAGVTCRSAVLRRPDGLLRLDARPLNQVSPLGHVGLDALAEGLWPTASTVERDSPPVTELIPAQNGGMHTLTPMFAPDCLLA